MGSSNVQLFNAQRLGAIALLVVCLHGCAPLGWSKTDGSVSSAQPVDSKLDTVTIAAIKQASATTTFQTKIVQLKGRVGNRAPLLGKTAYELQDATGSIWVLATDAIPNAGDTVVIQGKLLYQSIRLNGKEHGSIYIEQQQELQRTPVVKSDRGEMKAEG